MTIMMRLLLVSIWMIFAAPAFAVTASQLYKCTQDEDASDADVLAAASDWMQAAKTVKGGKNLKVFIHFPIAAPVGEIDFLMVVNAPNLMEWGEFMDNYEGSAVAKSDKKFADIADCAESTLWESIKIK